MLSRGNERRAVFRDDADREGFLSRRGRCAARFELEPFAYGLMGNHCHLLVRTRRDLLIYLLWRRGGRSLSASGEHFGLGYPAVSLAKGRGEAHRRNHRALRRQLMITI